MTPLRTVYLRIFLPFSISVLLASAAAWWIATTLLSNVLEQRVSDQLAHATETIATGNFPLTPELLEQLARLQDAQFALIRQDGQVGFATSGFQRIMSNDEVTRAWQDREQARGSGRSFELQMRSVAPARSGQFHGIAGVVALENVRVATQRAALWLGAFALCSVAMLAWWGHRVGRSMRDYEAELASKSRLAGLGELAARVAHEIRNPLTALKMQVQLLTEELEGDSRVAAEGLLAEIDRLDLVVGSTVALGRADAIQAEPAHLNTIIEDVVALVTPQYSHRQIVLETRLGELPAMALDANRIKQVIFNLLSNAADAISGSGTVRISTSCDELRSRVHLNVEDSGAGLDPAVADGLFETAATSKSSGLGVGLLISRELIELHGGQINAATSPDLGGARFTIELPIKASS